MKTPQLQKISNTHNWKAEAVKKVLHVEFWNNLTKRSISREMVLFLQTLDENVCNFRYITMCGESACFVEKLYFQHF